MSEIKYIHKIYQRRNNEGTFLSVKKLADVTPIFIKGSKNSKYNYRSISILKNLLKVSEKIMYK